MYKIQKKWPVLDIKGFIFRMNTQHESAASRPSPVYSCGKRNPFIQYGSFFCFNYNVSNLYNNDVIIYKIKKKSESSFVCERVYLFSYYNIGQFLKLVHKNCKNIGLYQRSITGRIYNNIDLVYYCTNYIYIGPVPAQYMIYWTDLLTVRYTILHVRHFHFINTMPI
jgi:hypothetical protein